MAIDTKIYDTATLFGVLRTFEPVPDYWLNLAFPSQINFETEYVDFSKIDDTRKLAPLVVPTTQGRPIYGEAERNFRVKPAYLKPKDVISGAGNLRRKAGLGELLLPNALSPQQRHNAQVAETLRQHRTSIERFWEWLAAKAVLDGKVTLSDEAYPTVTVDFERDAGHTIMLGGGSRWGDAGVSIVDDIESWAQMMRDARFGGAPNRITVGTAAWKVMKADSEIKELMRTDLRNTSGTSFDFGPREGLEVEFVGRLGAGLEVYVYRDYYHDKSGNVTAFMDPRDVVLTGPSIMGVRCFGAIQDVDAMWVPNPIWPKMWKSDDPSGVIVMTQSAPLMVPVNPNASLRARVIA